MTKIADPFLLALLAVSLAGNVYQYRRPPATASAAAPVSVVGTPVVSVRGHAIDGKPVSRSMDSPTILYAFSPDCVWCDRNLDNVRALTRQLKGRYTFVALALKDDGLTAYLKAHDLDWDVVRRIETDDLKLLGIVGTPQTIVIGNGGIVEHAWSGAWGPEDERRIESALGVELPEISST
jgi:hypothetical protein